MGVWIARDLLFRSTTGTKGRFVDSENAGDRLDENDNQLSPEISSRT